MRPHLNLTDEELELIYNNFILCKDNKPAHDLIYKIGDYLSEIKKYNKEKKELENFRKAVLRAFEDYKEIEKCLYQLEAEFNKKY